MEAKRATFSWDGSVVNFIDESFADVAGQCPPTTPAGAPIGGDSGRMLFRAGRGVVERHLDRVGDR